jgi:hypothetical protein
LWPTEGYASRSHWQPCSDPRAFHYCATGVQPVRHCCDGIEEGLGIVSHPVADCAEVYDVDLVPNLWQRILARVITGVGDIRQAPGRIPELTRLAPEA